jgi:hypothetical protein
MGTFIHTGGDNRVKNKCRVKTRPKNKILKKNAIPGA